MTKFKIGDKVKIIQRKKNNTTGTQPGFNKPNGNVGQIGYVTRIEGNYCIYTTKDLSGSYIGWFDKDDLELASEEVSTTPYVKGKWYDCKDWNNKHDYVKLDYIYSDKTRIYFTECIDNEEYRQINAWRGIGKKELFEADMSIVSQFLPNGHPDKITAKESPEGVSMETIQEEFIPEYVECIKSTTNSFTVGKIYDWPYPIDNQKNRRAIPIQGALFSFKPSTKEAYEAQFTKQEPIYVYVGDLLPTIKTKPLIEDVQSVSVNLRTKKKSIKF